MAITTTDFTFLDFIHDYINRLALCYQNTYIINFIASYVIELQDNRI